MLGRFVGVAALLGIGSCAIAPVVLAADPLGVEEYDSGELEVTLLELKRTSGDTVTAKWSYKNAGEEQKEVNPIMSDDYYLVDASNKKKYFVVKDSDGKPVAGSTAYNKAYIKPGKSFKMWAKFPAPPAATEKLSVYLDKVPPFEDVPVAK